MCVAACGAETSDPGSASEVQPPVPAAPVQAACSHGVWSGGDILHFDYLACHTDADCVVVQWGDECQNATTYDRRHADCVAVSPVCSLNATGDVPHAARCNEDGLCQLVLE